MNKILFSLSVIVLFSVGCTQRADWIEPTDVPTTKYEKLSCKQLKEEVIKVNETLAVVSAQQDANADKYATAQLFNMMGFFVVDYGGDIEEIVAKVKGEHAALKKVATKKNCSFADDMRDIK